MGALPRLDEDLSRSNALPGQAYHPEGLYDLNRDQINRDSNFFTERQNYGVGEGSLGADYTNDPMVQALNAGWDDTYNTAAQGIKTRNEMDSAAMESSQKTKAAEQAGAQYQNEVKNFQEQYAFQLRRHALLNQYKLAKKRAEAAAMGQIFGGVITVGAAVAGSAIKG